MKNKIDIDKAYAISEDLVAREIEGEMIIVPLTSGIGDVEDELFALNETGKDIWSRLDGKKTLRTIIDEISSEYKGSAEVIEKDVVGLMEELVRRNMVIGK